MAKSWSTLIFETLCFCICCILVTMQLEFVKPYRLSLLSVGQVEVGKQIEISWRTSSQKALLVFNDKFHYKYCSCILIVRCKTFHPVALALNTYRLALCAADASHTLHLSVLLCCLMPHPILHICQWKRITPHGPKICAWPRAILSLITNESRCVLVTPCLAVNKIFTRLALWLCIFNIPNCPRSLSVSLSLSLSVNRMKSKMFAWLSYCQKRRCSSRCCKLCQTTASTWHMMIEIVLGLIAVF